MARNDCGNSERHPVVASLFGLDDRELHTLIQTVNGVPQVAPGLLAWLEHVADW